MTAGLLSDVGEAKGETVDDRAHWGLASLIIGAVLLLDSSIVLVFNTMLWRSGPAGLPIVPALAAALLGLAIVGSLAALGVAMGVRGLRRDGGDRPPSPLAIAGVATGVAAILLWLVAGIDLILILASFAR
jgi:hypothetical protein